jgi:DNA-binding response OmpR family regulator
MPQIFFVNQDPKLIALHQPIFTEYFSFDSAHDGLTALRKIRLFKPSIIISDYDLPILSGLSLLKFVRSQKDFEHIPFLFFTDHDDPSLALGFGANDWLTKSETSPQMLADKVYHHLKINRVR